MHHLSDCWIWWSLRNLKWVLCALSENWFIVVISKESCIAIDIKMKWFSWWNSESIQNCSGVLTLYVRIIESTYMIIFLKDTHRDCITLFIIIFKSSQNCTQMQWAILATLSYFTLKQPINILNKARRGRTLIRYSRVCTLHTSSQTKK